jgi:hypothetical protein
MRDQFSAARRSAMILWDPEKSHSNKQAAPDMQALFLVGRLSYMYLIHHEPVIWVAYPLCQGERSRVKETKTIAYNAHTD